MMLQRKIDRDNVFEGVVKATDWDEGGYPTKLTLITRDEENIPIFMDLKAESLVDYCKEKFRLKGKVISGELRISSFKFIRR